MSEAKKADKISVEELHFLETLKKEFNMLNLKVDNTKLQYENALFKIMRKYDLKESDSIDETTGNIIRRTPPPPPPPAPAMSVAPVTTTPVFEAAPEAPLVTQAQMVEDSEEKVKSKGRKREAK